MARTDPVGDLGVDPACAGIVATILVAAVVQTTWGTFDDLEMLAATGAWTEDEGFRQPWRILSYAWVHAGPEHLVGNLIALVVFGWPLERAIGWRRFLLLYGAAVLVGGVAAVVITRPTLLVGASGGIFGVWSAMAAMAVAPRRMLHGAEVGVLREAVWPIGLALALQSFLPGVSWPCHLGGLAVGAVAGASGLLVLGLDPRADDADDVPAMAWGRAVSATLGVGVLACGCPAIMFVLLVAYVAIVGLVAWAEPRYEARDGWTVSLAALAVAGLLWGAGGLAVAVGRPWDPVAGLHWLPLADGLPEIQVPTRTSTQGFATLTFGEADDPHQVVVTFLPPQDGRTFAERWLTTATFEDGELHDEEGCPTVVAADGVVVQGPERAVRITARTTAGPAPPVFRGPEGCPPLTVEERARVRDARGAREEAARMRVAADPTDAVASIRLTAYDLACPERVKVLAERVKGSRSLTLEAVTAALDCDGPEPVRWVEAALARDPEDGEAWLLRATLAERRGEKKALKKALENAVRTLTGAKQEEARSRLAVAFPAR